MNVRQQNAVYRFCITVLLQRNYRRLNKMETKAAGLWAGRSTWQRRTNIRADLIESYHDVLRIYVLDAP